MSFDQLPPKEIVEKTSSSLKQKGYEVSLVKDSKDALEEIKKIIPEGASVMNGSSVTLEQIGFIDFLKEGNHKWNDLHAIITAEDDKEKRAELRRQSILSDYYLGSVHALVESGEFLVASNSGSQLPHIVYSSSNLIFVISTKKIVSSMEEAFVRLNEYVIPHEDSHMMDLYNVHTTANKIVIFNGEKEGSVRKIHIILVEEILGF